MEPTLNSLAKAMHEIAKEKGFWDEKRETGTLLMLIVSELAEAMEADRLGRYADFEQAEQNIKLGGEWLANYQSYIKDSFEDEIADVFIRLLDLCGAMSIDISKHIELKANYNKTRECKHGKAY